MKTESILRHNYESEKQFKEEIVKAKNRFDIKVKVDGGYKFFESIKDMKTWKKQK